MEQKKLFRQVALERLSSPEQIDRLVEVTSARGWTALLGIGIIITMSVVWGIFGSIPTKVNGEGILIKKGGLSTLYSSASGTVSELYIANGDVIKEGDVIARLIKPEYLDRIRQNEEELENIEIKYQHFKYNGEHDLNLQLGIHKDKKNELKQNLALLQKSAQNLSKQLGNYTNLYKEGLLTEQSTIEVRQKLNDVLNQIDMTENAIMHQNIQAFKDKRTYEQKLEEYEYQVTLAKQKLEISKRELKMTSEILSTYDGKVVELGIEKGGLVHAGSKVLTVENAAEGKDLQAIFFVPAVMGKQIQTRMDVQISPSITKREEFGFIKGKVLMVSEFPATAEGIKNIIDNDKLVAHFLESGTPLVVYAQLSKSDATPSGFEWSSSKGPPLVITSGTFCSTSVAVQSQAPISLVLPILKKTIGL